MAKTLLDKSAKKASVYHLRLAGNVDWETLSKLAYNPEQSLSEDLSRVGLVHPLSDLDQAPEDTVLEKFEGGLITALRIDKSVVTTTAIKQAAAVAIRNRLEELPDHEQLGKNEREAIAIAVRGKLLDAAPLVTKYVPVIIDTQGNRLIIFDTGEKVINHIVLRLNNAFAGNISIVGLTQVAAKASIPNIGIKLLESLRTLHDSGSPDVTDVIFESAPSLSFGTGVKLAKLDDTAGNHVNLPGFDLTDETIQPMLERATFVDWIGLFMANSRTDIEFKLNSQLQFTKLGLNQLVADGLDPDATGDIVAQLRGTAILLVDSINDMVDEVSRFMKMPLSLDGGAE